MKHQLWRKYKWGAIAWTKADFSKTAQQLVNQFGLGTFHVSFEFVVARNARSGLEKNLRTYATAFFCRQQHRQHLVLAL